MLSNLRKVMRDTRDRGASAVEYGLMVAAIAAVIVGIVFGLGTLVGNTFNKTCASMTSKTAVQTASDDACQTSVPSSTGN